MVVHGHVAGFFNINHCELFSFSTPPVSDLCARTKHIIVMCLWRAELDTDIAHFMMGLHEHLEKIFPVLPPLGHYGRGNQAASERLMYSCTQPFHWSDL